MMMRKSLLFSFSILFIACFVAGSVCVEPVGAVSYYNHLRNWSFESDLDLIEDASFESGLENQGIEFGNWSGGGSYSLSNPYSGLYSYDFSTTDVWYNFTDDYYTTGADIEEFGFWYRIAGTGYYLRVEVYYTDLTSNNEQEDIYGVAYAWQYIDVFDDFDSFINPAKDVVAFKLTAESGGQLDLVTFVVDSSESGDTQDEVTARSSPWRLYDIAYATESFWSVDSDLSSDEAYLGSQSYEITKAGTWFSPAVAQTVDFLDSDSVYYADMYVLNTLISDLTVNFYIHYTDGGSSSREVDIDADADWQYVNFGSSFIREGAVIDEVRFWIDDEYYDNEYIYVDCVGLWSDVELDYVSYSYSISPAPVYGYNGYQVALRYGINYQYYGHLYNESGSLDGDGIGMFGSEAGFTQFTIEDGLFNFTINARSGSSQRSEACAVTVILDDEDIERVYSLIIVWIPTTSDYDDGSGSGDGGASETAKMWDYIVWMAIMFAPPAVLAGAGSKDGWGAQGFVVGLCICVPAGMMFLGVPFWVILLIGMGMCLMLFAMIKRSM